MQTKKRKEHIIHNQKGSTLIELAATMAIMAFLGVLLSKPISNIPDRLEELRLLYKGRAASRPTQPAPDSDQVGKAGLSLENKGPEVLKSLKPSGHPAPVTPLPTLKP